MTPVCYALLQVNDRTFKSEHEILGPVVRKPINAINVSRTYNGGQNSWDN